MNVLIAGDFAIDTEYQILSPVATTLRCSTTLNTSRSRQMSVS